VTESGIKTASQLTQNGNHSGANEILSVIDFPVVVEMEKVVDQQLVSKENKKVYEELSKSLKKK